MRTTTLAITAAVAGVAFANVPAGWPLIEGCERVATTDIRGYFVYFAHPNTGEICDAPQCGGDRAAPNVKQPGCPFYTGTEELVYTAHYMAGTPYNNAPEQAPATTTAEAAQPTPVVSQESEAPHVTAAPVVEEPVEEKPEEGEVMSIQTETSVSSDTTTIPATSISVTKTFQTSTVVMPVAGNSTNGGSASATGSAKPVESSPAFTGAADKVAMSGLMAGVMAVLAFAI